MYQSGSPVEAFQYAVVRHTQDTHLSPGQLSSPRRFRRTSGEVFLICGPRSVIDHGWLELLGAAEALTAKLPIRGDVIESATTRKTAYFKAVVALLARAGARDFHEGETMTPGRVREYSIEAHHVFPRRWLSGKSFTEPADLILNQTPINKSTNASIGAKAPSEYLGKLKTEVKDNDLSPILRSHLINESDLKADDYSAFIANRYKTIVKELNKVIKPKKVESS
jgi:hypothetical protein